VSPGGHSAKLIKTSLPSARSRALGKEVLHISTNGRFCLSLSLSLAHLLCPARRTPRRRRHHARLVPVAQPCRITAAPPCRITAAGPPPRRRAPATTPASSPPPRRAASPPLARLEHTAAGPSTPPPLDLGCSLPLDPLRSPCYYKNFRLILD
jgi:hypothetical protein